MKQILLDLNKPEINLTISEPTEIFGVFVGTGDELRQCKLNVIHNKPFSQSLTLVKAVLFDRSRFDFEGNLIINTGAKHTDTYLKASVIMLSEDARARAVPSLEIMENDVKGGHGATVGQVDEEELFYLTSRGLSKSTATNLLVYGFLRDILDKVIADELKSQINTELTKLDEIAN